MSEKNKQILRHWLDILNEANVDKLEEVFDDNVIDHIIYHEFPGRKKGLAGYKQTVNIALEAFDKLHYEPTGKMISENDLVAVRYRITGIHKGVFMGISPKGNRVDVTGMLICRVVNSKIVEFWGETDVHKFIEQLK